MLSTKLWAKIQKWVQSGDEYQCLKSWKSGCGPGKLGFKASPDRAGPTQIKISLELGRADYKNGLTLRINKVRKKYEWFATKSVAKV